MEISRKLTLENNHVLIAYKFMKPLNILQFLLFKSVRSMDRCNTLSHIIMTERSLRTPGMGAGCVRQEENPGDDFHPFTGTIPRLVSTQ